MPPASPCSSARPTSSCPPCRTHDPEWEKEIKDNYDEIVAKCRNHVFGMAFDSPVGRNAVDTPPEEVQRIFEENWTGSFRWVFETFDDLLATPRSNMIWPRSSSSTR